MNIGFMWFAFDNLFFSYNFFLLCKQAVGSLSQVGTIAKLNNQL